MNRLTAQLEPQKRSLTPQLARRGVGPVDRRLRGASKVSGNVPVTCTIDFKIMFLGYSKGSVTPNFVVANGRLKAKSSKQQNHGFSFGLELSALSFEL